MKWRTREIMRLEYARKYRHWTPWFAWHPVVVKNGGWVWLEMIERRAARFSEHYIETSKRGKVIADYYPNENLYFEYQLIESGLVKTKELLDEELS